jgi:hypothetical protein
MNLHRRDWNCSDANECAHVCSADANESAPTRMDLLLTPTVQAGRGVGRQGLSEMEEREAPEGAPLRAGADGMMMAIEHGKTRSKVVTNQPSFVTQKGAWGGCCGRCWCMRCGC